jgi:hypothetical protein
MAGQSHSVPRLKPLLRVRRFARALPADRPRPGASRLADARLLAAFGNNEAMSGLSWSRRDVPPRRDQLGPSVHGAHDPAPVTYTILVRRISSREFKPRLFRQVEPRRMPVPTISHCGRIEAMRNLSGPLSDLSFWIALER